ncbi:MAG: peptidoglycan DD-metalloendopeptidase family protein [Mycobacteriales bacterium]
MPATHTESVQEAARRLSPHTGEIPRYNPPLPEVPPAIDTWFQPNTPATAGPPTVASPLASAVSSSQRGREPDGARGDDQLLSGFDAGDDGGFDALTGPLPVLPEPEPEPTPLVPPPSAWTLPPTDPHPSFWSGFGSTPPAADSDLGVNLPDPDLAGYDADATVPYQDVLPPEEPSGTGGQGKHRAPSTTIPDITPAAARYEGAPLETAPFGTADFDTAAFDRSAIGTGHRHGGGAGTRPPAAHPTSNPRPTASYREVPAWSASTALAVIDDTTQAAAATRVDHPDLRIAGTTELGLWARPIGTYILSSCFCMRWGVFLKGIDLAAPTGTAVQAASAGIVLRAGSDGGYGSLVVIDHGNGVTTRYGQVERLLVAEGDHVHAGQPVASVGTGREAAGPHLHFEVRLNDQPISPIPFLASRGVTIITDPDRPSGAL